MHHDPAPAPLIVTLALDPPCQRRFDDLRERHFPPERNHIPAHLTLFHALPTGQLPFIRATLHAAAVRARFPLHIAGLQALGRGVAYRLDSPELHSIHKSLAGEWHAWLTPQDRQGFRPHVVVQNKVSVEEARALLAALMATFAPWSCTAIGLSLWRYLVGPWEFIETHPFSH